MNKRTGEYWEARIANSTWRKYNDIEKQSRDILQMYRKAAYDINAELYAIEKQICKDGFLDEALLNRYGRLKKINASFAKVLKGLEKSTTKEFFKKVSKGMQDNYKSIAGELGIDLNLPNLRFFEELAKEPWRGEDFSKRIWRNMDKLLVNLKNTLVSGMIRGKSITELALELDALMNQGFHNAHRLVRTETMHYLNAASLQAYKDSGVKYVQFWAALDERTCPQCGALHGRIFKVDKAPVLPIHANCRCCYLPVTDKDEIAKFLKMGNNGGIQSVNSSALSRLVNYAEQKYGIKNANLTGLDAKAVLGNFRTLNQLLKDYPQLDGYIKHMDLSRSGAMAAGPSKNFQGVKLTFNPDLFSDLSDFEKYCDDSVKQHFNPDGLTPENIIAHEFGHVIESYLIKNNIKGLQNRANAWHGCLIAEKIVRDAASQVTNGKSLDVLCMEISNYATTDFSETLAEAFLDYYANRNKAKELSLRIIEEVKKWL
ncbi:minor capsid protein [Eubacterium limosum]|uniref:Phage head morphogenesis protein n=1 Tax=Eubacterium limosum TaxID=1736 RepID=A0AAC9QSS8_EUBLI|nr:minor capsid protein [Eubacterium limosum]ARD64997.1 phage head morphogenesis protein [Eubacterium limosum]PWW52976.1 SPP1 gp7 family putative phage head morphogenesis protein [Eubacterium limosum]UQZ20980.1 minor capsid protein [Eubacterium limosum]